MQTGRMLTRPSANSPEARTETATSSPDSPQLVDTAGKKFKTPLDRIAYVVQQSVVSLLRERVDVSTRATLKPAQLKMFDRLVKGMGSDENRIYALMKTRCVLALTLALSAREGTTHASATSAPTEEPKQFQQFLIKNGLGLVS